MALDAPCQETSRAIGSPSRALTMPTDPDGMVSAVSSITRNKYVLMQYLPGGRKSTCGPFWPPLVRKPSPSWKLSWLSTCRAKMRPGSSTWPSIDSEEADLVLADADHVVL